MWLAVEVVINDTGLLHQKTNRWLDDPSRRWEIAFADWRNDKLVRVQMEPIKFSHPISRPYALKPRKGLGGKRNRARWNGFAEGASNHTPKRYQGFARKLTGR